MRDNRYAMRRPYDRRIGPDHEVKVAGGNKTDMAAADLRTVWNDCRGIFAGVVADRQPCDGLAVVSSRQRGGIARRPAASEGCDCAEKHELLDSKIHPVTP